MLDQQKNHQLLLLFGMPRSGTTWLGKIFDSHPDILYLHEPDSEFKIVGVPILLTSNEYSKYRNLITQYCDSLLHHCTIRINGKPPFFNKSYFSGFKYNLLKINLLTAKVIEKSGLSIPVWNPFSQIADKKMSIAWKSIESCGRLGLILNSIENCKAVYIIRHPCGQIASVLNGEKAGNFSSKVSSSEDYQLFKLLLSSDYALKHSLSIEKIKAMKPLERLAIRWVLYNEQAIEDIEKTKKGIIVRYEDICLNPENEVKKLYEYFDLPWNIQTEQFVNISTLSDSNSYYGVYKTPKTAMSKWNSFFTKEEVKLIKKTVGDSKAGQFFIKNF